MHCVLKSLHVMLTCKIKNFFVEAHSDANADADQLEFSYPLIISALHLRLVANHSCVLYRFFYLFVLLFV